MKGTRQRRKFVAGLLALALVITFCTGCPGGGGALADALDKAAQILDKNSHKTLSERSSESLPQK